MPAGRPTKYFPELITHLEGYIKLCGGDEPLDVVPSQEGFICYLFDNDIAQICLRTLNTWQNKDLEECKEKDETSDYYNLGQFLRMLRALNAQQAHLVMERTARGIIKERTGNLVLAKHGYHEKSEVKQDLTVSNADSFIASLRGQSE